MSTSPILSSTQISPLDLMAQGAPATPDAKEAGKQFEGLLMANLFKEMRKTVDHSGLFGENEQARSTYEYLLDQAVVNQAMDAGATWGLRDRLEVSIKNAQKN